MKKSIIKNHCFTLLIAFILLAGGVKAQSTENWIPVILNTGGANETNGIEATYMLSSSNNTILVQLVNHNTYPVKASWKDFIITKNGQKLSGNNKQDSVTIAPKIRVSDDVPNTAQITIRLSEFQTNAADFKNFTVSDFDVTNIQ